VKGSAPPLAPGSRPRPSGRSGPQRSAPRAPSDCRPASVSPPRAPAAGSNSPTRAGSRACTGSLEVPLEIRDRLLIHAGRALVGLDPQPGRPDGPLGDRNGFGFGSLTRLLPPTVVDRRANPDDPSPSLHPRYRASLLSPSRFQPPGALPSTHDRGPTLRHWPPAGAGRQVHTFRTGARTTLAPPQCRTAPGQSAGIRQAHPGAPKHPRFRCHPNLSTRPQWFACARLRNPHLTRSRRAFCRDAHHDGS
jgi:hypothetical protein